MTEGLFAEKLRIVHPTVQTVSPTRYLPARNVLWYGVTYPNRLTIKYNQYFRYTDINSIEGWPYVMYVVFQSEEALLNLAEAYTLKEDYVGAVKCLNTYYSKRLENYNAQRDAVTEASVLSRYGRSAIALQPPYAITEQQETFLKCIMNIRNAEFMYEGLRWFDIKRMHIQITHQIYESEAIILEPNDPRRVLELPSSVLANGIPGNFDPESSSDTPPTKPVTFINMIQPSEVND
jgi:hypothetical protein